MPFRGALATREGRRRGLIGDNISVLVGTDFLWKAMPVGKLRELLADCADDDWIYADRNGDFAVIKADRFESLKQKAYPADAIVDVARETISETS